MYVHMNIYDSETMTGVVTVLQAPPLTMTGAVCVAVNIKYVIIHNYCECIII